VKARQRTVGSRLIDSRSWLASDDPYGSFAAFARRVCAAMKTCFVVLEQSEKTGSDESRVL
jgi:hypothetical protein